jgi:hypothetical protein
MLKFIMKFLIEKLTTLVVILSDGNKLVNA